MERRSLLRLGTLTGAGALTAFVTRSIYTPRADVGGGRCALCGDGINPDESSHIDISRIEHIKQGPYRAKTTARQQFHPDCWRKVKMSQLRWTSEGGKYAQ